MNGDELRSGRANWMGAILQGSTSVLKSYSALIFGQGTAAGLLALGASLFDLGGGLAGACAVLGSLLTTAALGYNRDLCNRGYFGFNAVLCGLALGHGQPLTALMTLKATILGSLAAVVTSSLSQFLDRRFQLPVLALPYVLIASLLGLAGSGHATDHTLYACVPDLPIRFPAVISDTLRSLGAIVYCPTTAAGLLVLFAAFSSSRILATFAVLGIALAKLVLGVSQSHVAGIWNLSASYNAVLVFMSIGCVLFVPSLASLAWASACGLLTVWLTIALGPILARAGLPVLAWPFVIVVFAALRALARRAPGRAPFAPSLPEANSESNLAHNRMLRLRFGQPGPARVALPVAGTWTVTQGFNGTHTHQHPWQHALDLEITDEHGFPFRGGGLHATDYYCFDSPVSATLAGTVVFTYGEHPDNAPGNQDLAYPYGNVVIIEHGPTLYSVLAHLKRRSVLVQVGQYVAPGTIVGRCGSSGRSPRPHLHFQIQSSGYLGMPTLPFEVSHFAFATQGTAEYVPFGVPKQGDRVAAAQIAEAPELMLLRVGAEVSLAWGRAEQCLWRSEVSPVGARSLHDIVSGDRLYFSALDGVASFTRLCARARSPLAVLALALPRVPPFGGDVVAHEGIPPEWVYAGSMRRFNGLLRLLGLGTQVNGRTRVTRTPVGLSSQTELEIRWLGRVWRRYRAAVEIEGATIVSLSLSRAGRPELQAAGIPGGFEAPRRRTRRRSLGFERILAYLAIPCIAAVASSSVLLSSTPSVARAVPSSLAESYRYESAGDLGRAIDAAARAAQESPHAYFFHLRLAYLKSRAKLYPEAAADYAEAAKLAPGAAEPLLGRLASLASAGSHARVLEVADEILPIDPKNYSARTRRAWALYELGRYSAAVEEYATVLELYPGDIEMRLGHAYALSGAKRPVEAAIEFREVLKRMPNNTRARAALGLP